MIFPVFIDIFNQKILKGSTCEMRSHLATSIGEAGVTDIILSSTSVFRINDVDVMLDSDVAKAFGLETKRINEAVTRNPAKFNDDHCFRLTKKEWSFLRSQTATSKSGRGGRTYAPQVFTIKGVARLATVLDSDEALKATDLIIDTFLSVRAQVLKGQREISSELSSEFSVGLQEEKEVAKFKKRLFSALNKLFDTVVDTDTERTLRDVGLSIGSQALKNVEERLREKGLQNAKLEADTQLVLAETEKLLAEARKTSSEARINDMDVITRQISIIRDLIALSHELEPVEFNRALGRFDGISLLPLQNDGD